MEEPGGTEPAKNNYRRRVEVIVNTALVGWSGFVGGNLLQQTSFSDTFRSSDIEEIAGVKAVRTTPS